MGKFRLLPNCPKKDDLNSSINYLAEAKIALAFSYNTSLTLNEDEQRRFYLSVDYSRKLTKKQGVDEIKKVKLKYKFYFTRNTVTSQIVFFSSVSTNLCRRSS